MSAKRLRMRQLREILRLKFEVGLSHRAIVRAFGVGLGTVSDYLQRVEAAGLRWPLPGDLDDVALEARVFAGSSTASPGRALPEWAWVHRELRRDGVTLQLLWHEYIETHPDGYRYSQFCERYRRWARKLNPSMRQVHRAGEKTFIDYSGKKPHLVDRRTGEERPVELFVAALGASSYIFAEATEAQNLPSWVGSHIRMAESFGGSTAIWVPDNLKSGITTPCRYEPEVNRTYADLAAHYGAVVIPARAGHPKDKPKVEAAVQVAQRWILAALRNRTFFSLSDLNAAIHERTDAINRRPMKKLGVSRRELFEQLDRPSLVPLPGVRYEMREWKPCRVNIDYHVDVDHNLYSVPHNLLHEKVEARFTQTTVEISFRGQRVATTRVPARDGCDTPHGWGAPFEVEGIVSDADIGAIVQLVQNGPRKSAATSNADGSLSLEAWKVDGRNRILAATARETGIVEVRTESEPGAGQLIELKKTDKGWEVVRVWEWNA